MFYHLKFGHYVCTSLTWKRQNLTPGILSLFVFTSDLYLIWNSGSRFFKYPLTVCRISAVLCMCFHTFIRQFLIWNFGLRERFLKIHSCHVFPFCIVITPLMFCKLYATKVQVVTVRGKIPLSLGPRVFVLDTTYSWSNCYLFLASQHVTLKYENYMSLKCIGNSYL